MEARVKFKSFSQAVFVLCVLGHFISSVVAVDGLHSPEDTTFDLELKLGEPLFLHCNLSNTKDGLHWTKYEIEITSNEKQQVLQNGTIYIPDPDEEDAGPYICERIPRGGQKVIISVIDLRLQEDLPTTLTLSQLEKLTLQCQVLYTGDMATVEWLKNGEPLQDSAIPSHLRISENDFGVPNATFTIDPVLKRDSGNYTCEYSSSSIRKTMTTEVHVTGIDQKIEKMLDELRTNLLNELQGTSGDVNKLNRKVDEMEIWISKRASEQNETTMDVNILHTKVDEMSKMISETTLEQNEKVTQLKTKVDEMENETTMDVNILHTKVDEMSNLISETTLEQNEKVTQLKTKVDEMENDIARDMDLLNKTVDEMSKTTSETTQELNGCLTQSGSQVLDGSVYYDGCQKLFCYKDSPIPLQNEVVTHGFEEVSGECYLPVDDWKSWDKAQTECQRKGSVLAKPPSDFQAFRRFLRNIDDGYWWLGGKLMNGNFMYPKHNNASVESYWASGRPQNGDCLGLRAGVTSPLYDVDCTNTYNFVCQLV